MGTEEMFQKPAPRSRQGCQRCRVKRRKCDEARPSCSRCESSGVVCSYAPKLSWGGRPFGKSSFGKIMANDIKVAVFGEPQSFVYGTQTRDCDGANDLSVIPGPWDTKALVLEIERRGMKLSPLTVSPSIPYGLSYGQRLLLDHFLFSTSIASSSHEILQTRFCSLLVPKALTHSHLLSALLCLAAVHRQSIGLHQSDIQVAYLRWSTIKLLSSALPNRNSEDESLAIATSLLLCLCDLFAGIRPASSYNMHLRGGGLMLTESSLALKRDDDRLPAAVGNDNEVRLVGFLRQMYVSFGITAMISGPVIEAEMARILLLSGLPNGSYVDIFTGCSTDLIPIFSEIRRLIDTREAVETCTCEWGHPCTELDPLMQKGQKLVQQVLSMLANSGNPDIRFHRDFQDAIDHDTAREYILLNQCYHHVALIFLYCQVLRKPSNALMVQQAVHSIVSLGSSIRFRKTKASPAVALTHPLFLAGSAATVKADREGLLCLLHELHRSFGCGLVKSSMETLRREWEEEANATSASR